MSEYNEIANREHDQIAGGKRVTSIPGTHQTRVEYDASGFVIYTGISAAGNGSSTLRAWLIKKLTNDSSGNPTLLQTATGAWDDRASLTYT